MLAASRRLGALLLALTLGACAEPIQTLGLAASFSDDRFRVEWQTAQTKAGAPLIVGFVENSRSSGVSNVRLRVETLDAQGTVIGTATAFAPGYLGGRSRTSFQAPLQRTGPGYRVSVIGWDPAGNGQ